MSSVLDQLGIKYGCDKSSLHHGYCDIYDKYLPNPAFIDEFRMLEIGYGGYKDPTAGGESVRMWTQWGPKMSLTVVDIHHKENVPSYVRFVQGSQTDPATYEGIGRFNVIIDDGSHINKDVIATFKLLWPLLNSGGLYFVEDTHSSYDPYYPDSSPVPYSPVSVGTAMEYFAELTHQVNKTFFAEQYHEPYDIEFIHFYKDLIIIKKS